MTPEKWKRVKEIFHTAVDLPDDAVDAFVVSESGDDQTVLAEVRSLLESHSESDSVLEAPALAAISKLIEDTAMPSRVGQIVGAYRLESEIGRGGMGAVYLASRADRAFDKKVAIKLIKRGLDTDEIVRRFRHERQILAGLEHPNITRLLDGGSTDDGLPFLVMDFVDGNPVNRFADEHKLSVRERLELFLRICSAVSHAHQSLVIHRDLKPSNILVATDGVPKLLDFGIAKLTAADGADHTLDKTANAFQALTPEYASPEQVMGQPVTTASDIYSLGVILYELLTGHKPYSFRSRTADEVGRVLSDTLPTKPSSICRMHGLKVETYNPQAAIRTLQGDLDNIVLMAMRREPERRYRSVEQFAADITRYLEGRPVIAREDTFGYRASKFVTRNKAGVAAGVGIAASLIGGLIAASRQARIAARQRDRARREARKAEKVNAFLRKMLSSADPRAAGRDSRVTDILRTAAESVETEFVRQPDIAADLNTTIGLTYLGLGDLAAAEHHLEAAMRARLEMFPRKSAEVATALQNYGKLLSMKGDFKGAEPLYLEALETLSEMENRNDVDVANVLDDLGYLKALAGDNETAIDMHAEELAIRRRVLGENHPDVARAMGKMANVYSVMGRHDYSEPLHRRSLRILRQIYGPEHPDVALTMINLVRSILRTQPAEAEDLSREVLELRRKLLGEGHPDVSWALYNLAFVLLTNGSLDEAEAFARETLAKRGPNLPDEHPVVSSTYIVLGRILLAKDAVTDALYAFETALTLRRKTLSPDHWLLATTQSFIGECLVRLGDVQTGRKLLEDSYLQLLDKLGPEHDQTREAKERWSRWTA
jgi:serine/threonine protein kinase/tetratricopeptide (TPR) repeat protein